jgi:hypothetical protein
MQQPSRVDNWLLNEVKRAVSFSQFLSMCLPEELQLPFLLKKWFRTASLFVFHLVIEDGCSP